MSAPHHSVSLTDVKASSASSLASAEATRLVHATLSLVRVRVRVRVRYRVRVRVRVRVKI